MLSYFGGVTANRNRRGVVTLSFVTVSITLTCSFDLSSGLLVSLAGLLFLGTDISPGASFLS